MKMPWLAALLNFFLMGAGYLYNGRRMPLGAALTVGALILTYVENQQTGTLYWTMFGAVLLNNTFLALDGYQEAQSINQKTGR